MDSFYFYGCEYQIGNYVQVATYDGERIEGYIEDIYETDDHFHSGSVITLTIGDEEVEDWKIARMMYIRQK